MFTKQGDSSANPNLSSDSDSESDRAPGDRPKPVLANATYLLSNTRALLDKQVVSIHPEHIPTDFSTAEDADRAEKIARNLRLDMNMYYEEHLQRALEDHAPFLADAQKAVELIHDKIDFASLEMTGALVAQADLREVQIQHLTKNLKDYYPPGTLQEFLDKGDWSDDSFKPFLATFNAPGGRRPRQIADTGMKVLKQLKTQLPYFGGSIEYQQNEKNSLEYYVYHISTLTRDANQQYGLGTAQGDVLPKDLKNYNTTAGGEVPFLNLRNLGTGVVESPFHKLPYTLQYQIAKTIDRLHKGDPQSKQAIALRELEAKLGQQGQPRTATEIWNGCDEDGKKHLFANVLRLPWSEAHLHGGESYEQRMRPSDLIAARSTERIQDTLPPRSNERAGLVNVAGVTANVLEKPRVASQQYAVDDKYQHLQTLKDQGQLDTLFPGAVPPANQTLQEEFEQKHQDWHDRAMLNAKPQIGGISGHTLGYMNLYAEALDQVPAEQRDQYPTPERLRTIMLAGLIGTKRHHSYDEVMTASTATGKGTVAAEGYNTPSSYGDVLDSNDDEIRKCARAALVTAQQRYAQDSHTVLKTMTTSMKTLFPDDSRAKTEKLHEAVGQYIQGLGRAPDSQALSREVAVSLKPKPRLPSVTARVANMERQNQQGQDPAKRRW